MILGILEYMFTSLETALTALVHTLPLEWFALIASFVEEVLAPIPSPSVMILTGSAAAIQQYSLLGLLSLIGIAAVGKTVGAFFVYVIADKAENILTRYFSKLFPVTHEEIEGLGNKLTGGLRDYVVLILLRAFPFMPSVVVSVGSGVLKIRMHLYLVSTFIGTIIRDSIYLYFGYAGITILGDIIAKSTSLEHTIEVIVLVSLGILFIYLYRTKRKG